MVKQNKSALPTGYSPKRCHPGAVAWQDAGFGFQSVALCWKNNICRMFQHADSAAPSTQTSLCRRVCRGTAVCRGCAGTGTEDARGAEVSCWDLLLKRGWPSSVSSQGFAALLRQRSRLLLFLLMFSPTRSASGLLHCRRGQKSPSWGAPTISSSHPGGTSRHPLLLLPSSSLAQTTTNHRGSTGTRRGLRAEEPTPRERPVCTLRGRSWLWRALRALSRKQLLQTFNVALDGFCSALPDGANSRLEEHVSPAEGGWLWWQRAAGTARGQLRPRSWRKLLGFVPRFQPRAMPLQSALLFEVPQEQRLLSAARLSLCTTPVL